MLARAMSPLPVRRLHTRELGRRREPADEQSQHHRCCSRNQDRQSTRDRQATGPTWRTVVLSEPGAVTFAVMTVMDTALSALHSASPLGQSAAPWAADRHHWEIAVSRCEVPVCV